VPNLLRWYVGNRDPSIEETITIGGVAVNLSGKTVRFKMRAVGSSALKVDSAVSNSPGIDGVVRYDWLTADVDTAGNYLIWWEVDTAGEKQDMAEALIEILAHAPVTADYIELEEFKATITMGGETYADLDIKNAITSASRWVDEETSRRFYPDADATQVRYYTPWREDVLMVDDIITITSLKTDDGGDGTFENTWTLNTDYTREPLNASADSEPWTLLRRHPTGSFYFPTSYPRTVELTGKFGWNSPPAAIKTATTIQAHRLLKRMREVPFGVAGIGLSGEAVRIVGIDPDAASLIRPYSRRVLVA
jgi:hypothetical protein